MNKLVTFGCSVTQLEGLKEELASLLSLPLLNVAECAGANQLQLSKLSELILHQQLNKDDIVYWQITSMNRLYGCLTLNHLDKVLEVQNTQFGVGLLNRHYVRSTFPNIFDNGDRLYLLCFSPLLPNEELDNAKNLEMLLSTLILLKHFCPKLLVVFGWESVMPPDQLEVFKQHLQLYKVDYINEGFVDFTVRNKFGFRFEEDDMHPDENAGKEFAKIVHNKMKSLGWV